MRVKNHGRMNDAHLPGCGKLTIDSRSKKLSQSHYERDTKKLKGREVCTLCKTILHLVNYFQERFVPRLKREIEKSLSLELGPVRS